MGHVGHDGRIDMAEESAGLEEQPIVDQAGNEQGSEEKPAGKTFTQAEVEALIKERTGRYSKQLQELKASSEGYSKQLSELTEKFNSLNTEAEQLRAENGRNEIVANVAKKTGLSESVVSLLRGDDEESLMSAAEMLKPNSAPFVGNDGKAPEKHTNEDIEAANRLFSAH